MAERARYILLDEQRRNAYDQAYDAMLKVASVRTALELSNTPHWSTADQAAWGTAGQSAYPIEIRTNAQDKRFSKGTRRLLIWIGIVLCVVLVRLCTPWLGGADAHVERSTSQSEVKSTRQESRPDSRTEYKTEPEFEVLPAPSHNTMFVRRGRTSATLKLNTRSGVDYYVKLINASTKQTARSWYIRGGKTSIIGVPSGSYHLLINEGNSWCGAKLGFGPGSVLYQTDDELSFEDTGSTSQGIEVTLYKVQGGNLSTTSISEEEFRSYE
jgi:hypothetical protein